MFVSELYAVALGMLIVSLFGWGSWTHCYKVSPGWRFEFFRRLDGGGFGPGR